MQEVMGSFPDFKNKVPLEVRYEEAVARPGYWCRRLTYAVAPGERVPAYLLVPRGAAGPRPAVLCLHQTNGRLGSKEPAGLAGNPHFHYAAELAQRGFVTLAPDYPSFGDYPYDWRHNPFASGSLKAVWNNCCALDLLQSLPEVRAEALGVLGHSLGGHNALFTAAFDRRLQVIVCNCGFTSFAKYYHGNLAGWSSPRYLPRIRTRYQLDPAKMPFDFSDVLKVLAPRAVLVLAPQHDDNFEVSGVRDCVQAAQPVFRRLGAADKLHVLYPDCGHDFPEASRQAAYAWLERWLMRSAAQASKPAPGR